MTTHAPKLERLRIEDIRTDGGTQARAALDQHTVEEYAEALRERRAGANWPPILVFRDQDAMNWLADGFHRVAAAQLAGLAGLQAEVRNGDRTAALRHAIGANGTHGLRRTRADIANAIRLAYENRTALGLPDVPSANLIAQMVGCSDHTVADQLRNLRGWATATARTGADGRTRPVPPVPRRPPPTPPAQSTGGNRPLAMFDGANLSDAWRRAWRNHDISENEARLLAGYSLAVQERTLAYRQEHARVSIAQALGTIVARQALADADRLAAPDDAPPPGPGPDHVRHATAPQPVNGAQVAEPPTGPGPNRDEVGQEIPPEGRAMWARRQEAQDLLTALSRIRAAVRRYQDAQDPLGLETNYSSLMAHLNQAYADLETLKPYAVCPSCHGLIGCRLCGGRMFVSKFRWDTCVPEEQRAQITRAARAARSEG